MFEYGFFVVVIIPYYNCDLFPRKKSATHSSVRMQEYFVRAFDSSILTYVERGFRRYNFIILVARTIFNIISY